MVCVRINDQKKHRRHIKNHPTSSDPPVCFLRYSSEWAIDWNVQRRSGGKRNQNNHPKKMFLNKHSFAINRRFMTLKIEQKNNFCVYFIFRDLHRVPLQFCKSKVDVRESIKNTANKWKQEKSFLIFKSRFDDRLKIATALHNFFLSCIREDVRKILLPVIIIIIIIAIVVKSAKVRETEWVKKSQFKNNERMREKKMGSKWERKKDPKKQVVDCSNSTA